MSIKTDAVVIRDETTTGANTATRVGTNLVDIADDLVAKQAAIDLNTAKETNIAHPLVETAVPVGAVFTDNDTVYDDTAIQAEVDLNTAKVGVTTEEANPDVVSQVEAEAGVATTERIWTAQRVKQAIDALAGGGAGVSDTAYDISWDGVTGVAPSKNALYDFIESQVFKVDVNSNILPLFWGGTQAEYDAYFNITDFPTGVPNHYFTVITDGALTPTTASDIVVDASGFSSNLSATDTDVQTALGTIDSLVSGGTMTDAEVKIAYENNLDTNAFTDAEKVIVGNTSGTNTGDQDIYAESFRNDGETDNEVLQKAFDYISNASDYTLGFTLNLDGERTYSITEPLRISGDNWTINGNGATIHKTTDALPVTPLGRMITATGGYYELDLNAAIIMTARVRWSKIENLNIQGNDGEKTVIGIVANGYHNSFERVYAKEVNTGFLVSNMFLTNWTNCEVRNSVSGWHYDETRVDVSGVPTSDGATGTSTVFSSCHVVGQTGTGFDIKNLSYSSMLGCAVDGGLTAYSLIGCYGFFGQLAYESLISASNATGILLAYSDGAVLHIDSYDDGANTSEAIDVVGCNVTIGGRLRVNNDVAINARVGAVVNAEGLVYKPITGDEITVARFTTDVDSYINYRPNAGGNLLYSYNNSAQSISSVSGTNTGDNAVNTLYSGLVSATTANVKAINDRVLEPTVAAGAYAIDYSLAETWFLAITEATALTELNLPSAGESKVITIHISGNFALTYPAGWDTNITGAYAAGAGLTTITVEYVATAVPFYKVLIVQ